MLWEVRNLGFGEKAARRETMARVEQAKFEKIRLLDQVAAEIAEAHAQVIHRRQRIDITRQAIQSAQNSYERNLSRIRDGQGLPIEVLQSVRALEEARRAYLKAVVEYNQAQFQLQWALGWQVVAPANSAPAQ
jgi:outer membrane protein TolC